MNRQAVWSFVAVMLFGLLAVHLIPALAEDEDATQRAQLIEAINNEVTTIARQLERSRDDDTDDTIQIAIRQTDGMAENIDHLKNVKGDDSTANAVIDHYPGYIDAFLESAKALAKLKNAQVRQNEKMLWKRCDEEGEHLRQAVKNYLEPPDPAGLDKLPAFADNAKSQIHDEYTRQLDQANEVTRARDDARKFSVSDAGWSDVTSRMRDGADGIWGIYDSQLKNTREKCGDLEKGRDNPLIAEAMAKLQSVNSSSKQTLQDILRDWGAWKDLRRELAAKYVVNADKVRMAICDGDDEHIRSRVEDAETAAQSNVKSGYETLNSELDQLIERIGRLEDDKGVGPEARKWRGVMRGAKTRLEKVLKDGGILQGIENAKVRARIQIGIDKHAQLQTGCTAHEYEIPDGRIDCLNVSDGNCEVIEFKPDNDKARAKGIDQINRYRNTIVELHADKKLPGLLERCVQDGELKIKYDVQTYEFCPVPDDDIDAMLAEQAKQSSSTSDE